MKIIKILRKQCLRTGCKEKATHFGISGHKNYGLCNEHYTEFHEIINRLSWYEEQIKTMLKEDAENANPAN